MTSNLIWIPVEPEKMNDLPNELKFILRKRYGNPIDSILDNSSFPYLQGLGDAGVKGVDKIINAIRKHGEIRVKEYWG